jgi:transketolase
LKATQIRYRGLKASGLISLKEPFFCYNLRTRSRGGIILKKMGIDALCINTIRFLAVDAVQNADSGHPGMPMGMAPTAYLLWTKLLKYNPKNPHWLDRDRFVLSAGHGSMLLYSMLFLTGYDLSLDDIKNFRKWGSRTPGHPEYGVTPGVECTTGPLGQGFANGVGMAIAERYLAAKFNRPGHEIVDHYTFAICSDGDMMEGISSEAASLAGHLGLGKLIYIYDNNHITLSADTKLSFTEDVNKRFDAYGWHTQSVEDGNDLDAMLKAVTAAKEEIKKPSLISIRTHLGYGSPNKQDSFEAHGSPLGEEEVRLTKDNLGWPPDEVFYVPDQALKVFREAGEKGPGREEEWTGLMRSYGKKYPELLTEWELMTGPKLPEGWDSDIPAFDTDPKGMATRSAGGKVLNAIAEKIPSLIGGSADLDPSTKTAMEGRGDFQHPGNGEESVQGAVSGHWGYGGANIAYGVREHAMGAISTGMSLHGGLIPFTATFLIFSDYMRPAIRLAALSSVKVIYVFTHDSIALGKDGPTHQPVEHLASLRAMPGIRVIRPADANETAEAWRSAIMEKEGPVALVLTRQNVPVINRSTYSSASGLHMGAYILADAPKGRPELIIIATGSEVHLALEAYEKLTKEGAAVRVVSMPCWESFEKQSAQYKDKVLPPGTARVTVEAASTFGWERYAGQEGISIGIDRFGASAKGSVNLEKFGFTAENIIEKSRKLLNRGEGRKQKTAGKLS